MAPVLAAHLHHLHGLLEVARHGWGRTDIEASYVRRLLTASRTPGSTPLTARARADLGRWLLGQGRDAEAQAQLAQARETFEVVCAPNGWLRECDLMPAQIAR